MAINSIGQIRRNDAIFRDEDKIQTQPEEKKTVQMVEPKEKDLDKGVTLEYQEEAPKAEENQEPQNVEEQQVEEKKIERELVTKADKKEAREEISKEFQEKGCEALGKDKIDKKEADKLAKDNVKNEERIEKSDFTESFIDKKACKDAKKEQKAKEKELMKQYMADGLTKKEAKEKVKAQHIDYRYIGSKKTQKFINEHKDLFFDENGNYSADKARKFAREQANLHTTEGETENGYLSLKERRQAAEKYGVKDDVIANIAKNTGHGFEKDNTEGYRALYVAGTTLAGAGLGFLAGDKLLRATATAHADSTAIAKDAAGNVLAIAKDTADAKAQVRGGLMGSIAGGLMGLGIGLGTMNKIKDPGGVEPKVYAPKKAEVHQEIVEPEPQPVQPEPQPVPEPQPEPCEEARWESAYCDHTVKKGDDWTRVAVGKVNTINGKKPEGKVLRAYVHAMKLKHGVTNFRLNTFPKVGENVRLYSDFADLLADEELVKKYPELLLLKDAEIELNCDGKVISGRTGRPKVKYTPFGGAITPPARYKQDCKDPEPVLIR